MTHRYPDDPHARLRAAERDIEHYLDLLAGDGLKSNDIASAAHYLRRAARARQPAREQISEKGERERVV